MVRPAYSLNVLLEQLNNHAPNRSKISDGWIGDPSHSLRNSDHNPDINGVVHARDYTHDPDGGLNCNWLASQLHWFGDKRIKYVIWNAQIWTPSISDEWRKYTGINSHAHHLHVSVNAYNGDDRSIWQLYNFPTNEPEDDMSVIFAKGPTQALTCKVEFSTGASGVIAYRTIVPNPNEPGFKLWLRAGNEIVVTETQADFDAIPYKPGTPGASR